MPNKEALRVYIEALDAVPLPVQRWEVPKAPEWSDAKERKPYQPYQPPALVPRTVSPCSVSMPGGNGLDCTCSADYGFDAVSVAAAIGPIVADASGSFSAANAANRIDQQWTVANAPMPPPSYPGAPRGVFARAVAPPGSLCGICGQSQDIVMAGGVVAHWCGGRAP
jgi:hypothetical protein